MMVHYRHPNASGQCHGDVGKNNATQLQDTRLISVHSGVPIRSRAWDRWTDNMYMRTIGTKDRFASTHQRLRICPSLPLAPRQGAALFLLQRRAEVRQSTPCLLQLNPRPPQRFILYNQRAETKGAFYLDSHRRRKTVRSSTGSLCSYSCGLVQ